jgi:hypothetical protein
VRYDTRIHMSLCGKGLIAVWEGTPFVACVLYPLKWNSSPFSLYIPINFGNAGPGTDHKKKIYLSVLS